MNYGDLYSGTALSGAGSGAASGAMAGGAVGGGYGALIGGVGGGLAGLFGGAYANSQRNDAASGAAKNAELTSQALHTMSNQNYAQYLQQLKKAQSYYGPVMDTWDRLYARAGDQTMRSKMGMG
jgi:hypothetical protein